MRRFLAFCVVSLLAFSGCALSKEGGLSTGLDGCTSLHIGEGQISIPTMMNANGKNITWHKINDKCKDVPYHGTHPNPVVE